MRLPIIALFGLIAGGFVALGQMSAAQLQHAGQALLSLALAHSVTVLPWLLAVLFAWRYWRWKKIALDWMSFGRAQIAANQVVRDLEMRAHEEAARRTAVRRNGKRAAR